VIAGWAQPERCDAVGYVRALDGLVAPQPPGALGPFALSEAGALEEFAARAGLAAGERREVMCTWAFPDRESLLRALTSTRIAIRAAASAGDEQLSEAVLGAIAPYRSRDGGYRLENVFIYLIATT
jgi:hypothetical protein